MNHPRMCTQVSGSLNSVQLSILDLAPVSEGAEPADAFRNSLELARYAEQWGFHRYWLAEHHSSPGTASSATSVLISHIAALTRHIRVGSGGIMLPNHAPLAIAEQFGTLESLYPGRIDLGIGRAPGSNQAAARALRRDTDAAQDFPERLGELRSYFKAADTADERPRARAVPGERLEVPIWLLGSSDYSARLAGTLGLPFAFAGQFSPAYMMPALSLYRRSFVPTARLQKPLVMVGVHVIAADTDEQAQRLATSLYQKFLALSRGRPSKIQPPVHTMDGRWTDQERHNVLSQLRDAIIGSPSTVQEKLHQLVAKTQADELIIATDAYRAEDRLRSYEIVRQLWGTSSLQQ